MKRNISRRDFLKTSSLASAFFIVPRHVLGRGFLAPSDRLNFGFIGCGKQSNFLLNSFLKTNQVEFVAASDVFQQKTERFINSIKKFYQTQNNTNRNTVSVYSDFRQLLQRKDIDAVIIALPDHWHAAAAVRACAAGKDVYCEKPLSLTVAEGRAMVNAARKYDRVFQTGSMQRSWNEFRQAVELVRNGYIGDITEVKINVGGPPKDFDLTGEPIPDGMDWQSWLGPNVVDRPYNKDLAPTIEYEPKIWPKWRDYKDFGGGGMTDWGAHMFDIAQWGLDMDHSGPVKLTYPTGITNARDGLVFEYANGIKMTHQTVPERQSCTFIGTKGQVYVARGVLKTLPDETLKSKLITGTDKRVYYSDNHYKDFIEAIRKRCRPICDVETGHRTATVCNIGNIAYQLQRSLQWNPQKEKFEGDDQANQLLHRAMKKEWMV
ncbi:MAG: Gfo/Idh/MocA family oxidoreductase [Bacteroidota bacterium]|nr:Gfo/Idh/MocA family oxidoreductase [Bacteroidota bacterium]